MLVQPGRDADVAPVVRGLRRPGDPFRPCAGAVFRIHRQAVVCRVEVADIAGVRPLLRGTGFAGSVHMCAARGL